MSQDKETTVQAQNLAKGRAGTAYPNPGRDAGQDAGRDAGREVGRDAGWDRTGQKKFYFLLFVVFLL